MAASKSDLPRLLPARKLAEQALQGGERQEDLDAVDTSSEQGSEMASIAGDEDLCTNGDGGSEDRNVLLGERGFSSAFQG